MFPIDYIKDFNKDKQINEKIEYNKLLIQNSNLARENERLNARIIDFENKLAKINKKFLILPNKTLVNKDYIVDVSQRYEDLEYYIIIDLKIDKIKKAFNYGKDKKLMEKDYKLIIGQLVNIK